MARERVALVTGVSRRGAIGAAIARRLAADGCASPCTAGPPTTPMGRWGRPEDAAALVAWLVSGDAGWVTGQVIASDGGWGAR